MIKTQLLRLCLPHRGTCSHTGSPTNLRLQVWPCHEGFLSAWRSSNGLRVGKMRITRFSVWKWRISWQRRDSPCAQNIFFFFFLQEWEWKARGDLFLFSEIYHANLFLTNCREDGGSFLSVVVLNCLSKFHIRMFAAWSELRHLRFRACFSLYLKRERRTRRSAQRGGIMWEIFSPGAHLENHRSCQCPRTRTQKS